MNPPDALLPAQLREEPVQSWGRLSGATSVVADLVAPATVAEQIGQPGLRGLAYGNGRSYGDVCLNPHGRIWRTRALDRFIAFDADTGLLRCDAGVLLGEIIDVVLPRGWFVPVTPGTQFVTVGGAIANDVHGKNHHRNGNFGAWVRSLTLARTDGSRVACGPGDNHGLFAATVGGMGLTGVILDAQIQLRRVAGPWMDVDTQVFPDLDAFFALARDSEATHEYTVAWVDCTARGAALGRGIFLRANHAPDTVQARPRTPRRVPFTPPVSLVNRVTLPLLNGAYYQLHRWRQGTSRQHYQPYFYPLDGLLEWNRLYGPRGFYQYQSVVPPAAAREATREMLQEIGRSGTGSFLAVLKVFGEQVSPGMLSFPMPGTTLALDFPNVGTATHVLFGRLDAIVRSAGGRIYPAKDARMPRDLFLGGYPRLAEFLPYRDPGIDSALARRLLGSP
jgi:FAD/FMN-containing dehydrogenase